MINNSLLIAQQYVPREELKRVAQAILLSQKIKEESWVEDKSLYTISDYIATVNAVNASRLDSFWIGRIFTWNVECWNDIQSWAEAIIATD